MHDTYPLLVKTDFPPIYRDRIDTLQANLGYRCNQSCTHCHVAAGPHRTEEMHWETMELLLRYPAVRDVVTLDLTGGAPELNPHFRTLVARARHQGVRIIDRCNLTILTEPGQEDLAAFLAEHRWRLPLPCPAIWRKTSTSSAARACSSPVWPACGNSMPGIRPARQRPDAEPGLQPPRPDPTARSGGSGSRLPTGAGGAPRYRFQPSAGVGQHADPALWQPTHFQRAIQTLHGPAQVRASGRKPGRGDVPRI